eukprot:6200304-Pleurochrysis_carterae.AAC.1
MKGMMTCSWYNSDLSAECDDFLPRKARAICSATFCSAPAISAAATGCRSYPDCLPDCHARASVFSRLNRHRSA